MPQYLTERRLDESTFSFCRFQLLEQPSPREFPFALFLQASPRQKRDNNDVVSFGLFERVAAA